ncbi:hypothetical protein HMPREF0973_02557 [Prevotella veroralis F0319]|uniref:Uncharacterized protein n=1 Tax=Prevotella veroralis F0319 TaxID=649761 RepID=C9MSD8_9BACT|nr:hypothetical protein HMPREF0973_02557 [Prevotella veroralis F0319]
MYLYLNIYLYLNSHLSAFLYNAIIYKYVSLLVALRLFVYVNK